MIPEIAMWAVSLLVIVLLQVRVSRRVGKRLEQRAVVMDRQQKQLRRESQRLQREAVAALERAKNHHQSAKDLNRRVDRTLKEHNGR